MIANDGKWSHHMPWHTIFSQAWPDGTWLCSVSTGFFCISQKVDIWSGVTDDSLTNGQTLKDRATQLLRSRESRALVRRNTNDWTRSDKSEAQQNKFCFEIKCYLGRIKAVQWIWCWPWWRWWQATIFLWIQIQTFRLFNNKTVSSGVLCKEAAIKWGGCWVVINWHFWALDTTRVGKNGKNCEGIGVSSSG